jgi:branched-chain amino acid transport system substrate-binding protein
MHPSIEGVEVGLNMGNPWTRAAARLAAACAFSWAAASAAQAQQPQPQQQQQPIVIAQIGPFTVLPSPDAKEVNEGARAWFQQVNRNGGVRGRQIEFFELDDKFNPDEFLKQLNAAMLRKPVALITPIGSQAMSKLVSEKLLDQHAVTVVNAIPGAEVFRNPGHGRLFHIRAGDAQQIEKILAHASTLGVTRVAVLHQDLPIGHAGLKVAQEIAAKQQPPIKITGHLAKHEPAPIAAAAKSSLDSQPQAMLVIGSPKFMADAVADLRKGGGRQFIFALSYMPAGLAVKVVGSEGARGVGIAQTFPNPNGVAFPVQRDFQAAMRAAHPAIAGYTLFQLEGYISARVLTEGLRRINGDLSADNLARALKTMGPLDLGGFTVSFGDSNIGSRFVDIGVIDGRGKLMY